MPLHNPATEAFVNSLLGQMTVDEKIGQLHQYFAFGQFDREVVRQGRAGSVINAASTPAAPGIVRQPPRPSETPTQPEPPAVTPAAGWPDRLASRTASKLGLHVVRNNDPSVMEYVRRVRPRFMKSVDDLGWLSDVKLASPNTITIGRISGQDENWPEQLAPDAAATLFISTNLDKYRLNPGVDYWEGWNEFVPVSVAHWQWYAAFEAARACDMQALGLHAAVGGFAAGTPEYAEMSYFIPALQVARRCGAIFTLHEGVSPLPGCGVFINQAGTIPGAPMFPGINLGYLMLRYRLWYEGYLRPLGLADLPLEISEVAVGGIVPGQPCNGPGDASWKDFLGLLDPERCRPEWATGLDEPAGLVRLGIARRPVCHRHDNFHGRRGPWLGRQRPA